MERLETVMEILDKLKFFQGQRAGRELWNDKPVEVQEEDLENYKRDIDTIRSYIWKDVKELQQYRDAEEQGLLLRLPVPEGTDVYELIKIVDYGEVGDKGEFKYYHRKTKFCRKMIEEFGKTVFLTEGQAAQKIHDIEEEQALAKMEKNNNE